MGCSAEGKILTLINQDRNLKQRPGKVQFTLRITPGEKVQVDPPVLHEETLEKIYEQYLEGNGAGDGFSD